MKDKDTISLLKEARFMLERLYEHRHVDDCKKAGGLAKRIGVYLSQLPTDHIADTSKTVILRDQFAMAALQGFMASTEASECKPRNTANWIYQIADAMLKEREKCPQS